MTLQTSLERVLQAPLPQTAALATVVCLLHLLYRRRKRASISCIPGPEKSDPLFGNLTDLYFEEAGESYFKWQEKYGQVFKIHGLLGVYYFEPRFTVISDKVSQERVPYDFGSKGDATRLHELTVIHPPEAHSESAQDALRACNRRG